jgi:DNA-binding CsgD family transcriptional regulator
MHWMTPKDPALTGVMGRGKLCVMMLGWFECLDGHIRSKPNISEPTRRGNTSSTLIGDEMCKSKSVHMFSNVGADATPSEAWDGGSVREGDRLELSPLTTTRESACPPGCRVCFLARKYGLTPREVTLIALISSGKSGRAISQTLGVGMPTIRKYCSIIHDKIGTHSRLAIGLWALREGMVKSAVQPVDRV